MIYIVGIAFLSTALSVDLVDEEVAGRPDADGGSSEVYRAPIFENADDCCSLTWEPLLQDESGSRFIPSTAIPAIPADKSGTGSSAFWARHVHIDNPAYVGVIDDTLRSAAHFVIPPGVNPTIEDQWNKVFVLSNPNGCILQWRRATYREPLFSTSVTEYPSMRMGLQAMNYVRDLPNFVGGYRHQLRQGNRDHAFGFKVWEQGGGEVFRPLYDHKQSFDVLAIDCAASLRSELRAELVEFHFEGGDPMNRESDDRKIVTVTEMINNSDFDQNATIELDSSVSSSLYMSHRSQLHDLVSTSWGVNASVSLPIFKMFNIGKIGGEWGRNSTNHETLHSGEVSYRSHEKLFKYGGKVTMKKRTKSMVTMKTKHIKGSHRYSAKYRIGRMDILDKGPTTEHVKFSLRRQGFKDWNKVENLNGDILFASGGVMKIESGVDTHIVIQSVRLGGKDQERRRSVNFDPLPDFHGETQCDCSSFCSR